MKRIYDSVAIAAVYMGEDLFPADRKDLSSDYRRLQKYVCADTARFNSAEEGNGFVDNYKGGKLKYAMSCDFRGVSEFSIAVSIYLDEVAALGDVPGENRVDHICALARQYIVPAEIDIPEEGQALDLTAHQCQPDMAAG